MDELNELYRQYGEIVLKMELLNQRYQEIRNKLLQELQKANQK